MAMRPTQHHMTQGLSRRQLLQPSLAAGLRWPPGLCLTLTRSGAPKRGHPSVVASCRARGWDPVHFDPQVTRNFKSHTTLSFVYSKLLRHKVGPDVRRVPSLSSPIWRNAGNHPTTRPTSSTCDRASSGTISRLSMGVNW